MNQCSYFIENKALFGSYPSQEHVELLEKQYGVKYFIDLTCAGERHIKPYKTLYTYLHYPIVDRNIPKNWNTFALFIIKICDILKNLKLNEKIYINCRGGHGRSGIVVACVLCYYFQITPYEALKLTKKYHNNRLEMREKWRKIGSPQTKYQISFIYKFFNPLYFYKPCRISNTMGFSNFSDYTVEIEDMGVFPTAESAYNAFKCPTDKQYVERHKKTKNPIISKRIGNTCVLRSDWKIVKNDIMYKIIEKKFNQHPTIKENLIRTGLGLIIMKTNHVSHIELKEDNKNILGKLLTKLRLSFYRQQLNQQQLLFSQSEF